MAGRRTIDRMPPVITIAGGGIAGLSLGIALRRSGVPVTLHDPGAYPRHRVCGEFICGVQRSTLDSLGISALLSPAQVDQTTTWYVRNKRVLSVNLPKPGLGISRHMLDGVLVNEFQRLGGRLCERSRHSTAPREGLVWCAGRMPSPGKWIGLKCHALGLTLQADLEMHLGRKSYIGLSKIEEGLVNICGLFRVNKSLGGTLEAYLAQAELAELAQRIRKSTVDTSSICAVAGLQIGRQNPRPGTMALGDAFCVIPPFTGNGMSMAFESALIAHEPLVLFHQGRISWPSALRTVERNLAKRFRLRSLFAQCMHPFLMGSAGQMLFAVLARNRMLPFAWAFQKVR